MVGQLPVKILGTLQVWLVLGLLMATTMLTGCHYEQPAALRLQAARSALQNQLSSVEQTNDGSSVCRLLVECFKAALSKVDSLPENRLTSPIPVFAVVWQKDNRLALQISWVEDGFDVSGFYLSDKSGKVTEYPGVIGFNRDQGSFLTDTAWRERWVPVILDTSDKSWKNQWVPGVDPPPILLPVLDYAKGEIRLGLLTKSGRESSTVTVGFGRKK